MNSLRVHLVLGGALALAAVTPAFAQPEVRDYSDTPPPAAPAPAPAPAQPQTIIIGPDGQVVTPPPAAPTGVIHYDGVFTGPGGGGDEETSVELHGGPTPELHVVRRGDTLWDICWYYFNDPWQWPKVWSYNGQISNPHWIYPGDLVRLLPKGFLTAAPVDPGLEPETDPDARQPDVVTPQRRLDVAVRQVAFIDKKHLDSSMFVVGAVEDKELLSTGDDIYVSYPASQVPKVGDRYSVYAEDSRVEHSGKVHGSYVRILGELQITSVKQGKRAQARITDTNSEIERGNRVGPLMRQFKSVPPVRNEVDLQGSIVAMLTQSQLIGQGEVVFIDVGKDSGIKPGNRLFVVRRGDAFDPDQPEQIGQDDRAFPARTLGEVVIIQVGASLSVGLVDRVTEEMGIGDLVMMRKQ
ncbi:MAG TPA: LysM peptidoglycan-binding domain-containing protein [Kofleriaceae bacterium]|nr:LysM peptidoglycan-binding domain-containing protein [Kofleriaceae bacterium]